jgi:hypothetical protein
MPKYRQLHTKIIDSFDFNDMPDDFTRVLWLLLIVVVDSEGRGINNPAWLRSKMFPLRQDIELKKISAAMEWLEKKTMIVSYEHDGKKYFYIPSFSEYQSGTYKEGKSYLPAPNQQQTNGEVSPPQHNTIQHNTDSTQDENLRLPELFNKFIGEIPGKYVADEIELYEKECKHEYLLPAFKEMVAKKYVRNKWQYVKAILDDWRKNGKKDIVGKEEIKPKHRAIIDPVTGNQKLVEVSNA